MPNTRLLFCSLLALAIGCTIREAPACDPLVFDCTPRTDTGPVVPDTGPPLPDVPVRDAGGTVCTPECGVGETCLGGACCDRTSVCAGTCCASGDVCSFGTCTTPGTTCGGSSDCGATEYCDFLTPDTGGDLCAGSPVPLGRCLPRPPECGAGGVPGETCLDVCEFDPATFSFAPVVRYAWPEPFSDTASGPFPNDVTVTPIVVQLDDDNCDGETDAQDLPDIVFTTFLNNPVTVTSPGTLHALTVLDGNLVEKWSLPGVVIPGYGQLAGGQFHPSPGGEVIACATDGTTVAVSSTGTVLWRSPPVRCRMPALGDLDQDGDVEVVVEGGILEATTGRLLHPLSLRGSFVLSDIDGDGRLDVVGGLEAFDAEGMLIATTGNEIATDGGMDDQIMPAVVDLDLDGRPEIALVIPRDNNFALWRYSATTATHHEILRAPFHAIVDGPPQRWGVPYGMGPITSGDFNADGHPDLGYTGFAGYVVLDGAHLMDMARPSALTAAGVLLWSIPTEEDNGSTGSAVFDFNGDGRVEVLYNATDRLHILSAATGESLGSLCNTGSTIYEYPVVADVDGDGEANVIIVANAYVHGGSNPSYECDEGGVRSWQSGIRILGSSDGSWVRAPRVWNQHSYHVTNVDEDGVIPRVEVANWTVPGLNNFRQNRQPGADYAAPDASVAISCVDDTTVRVTVRNVGPAFLPAGLAVDVLDEMGAVLATVSTTHTLDTAQSEAFDVDVGVSVWAPLHAVVQPASRGRDCRTDNDTALLVCLM